MKKVYLFFAFIFVAVVSINAQITLTQKTHGIVVGDAFHFIFTKPVDEGNSGKNVKWDFSNLVSTEKTLTSHMLNTLETPKGGEISNSNVVIEEFGNNFYFKDSKSEILDYGFASTNVITKYDKPAVKLKFPFSYGDKINGDFSGKQSAGTSEYPINGTYEIFADAYGSLKLPNGVELKKTLRVKQSRSYNNCSCKEIVYRWYVANIHYPVLVVTKYVTADGKETVSQTAYHPMNASNLKNLESDALVTETASSISVFPNPWVDNLTVNYVLASDNDVEIVLYDNGGKIVKILQSKIRQSQGSYTIQIDETLDCGTYFLKIFTGNSTEVKKLVKQ